MSSFQRELICLIVENHERAALGFEHLTQLKQQAPICTRDIARCRDVVQELVPAIGSWIGGHNLQVTCSCIPESMALEQSAQGPTLIVLKPAFSDIGLRRVTCALQNKERCFSKLMIRNELYIRQRTRRGGFKQVAIGAVKMFVVGC